MKKLKICIIMGARPQYIKAAMLMQAIEKHNQSNPTIPIEPYVVHTGQHYDYNMFGVFFDQFKIRKPDIDLGISGCSHGKMVGKMMIAIESGLKMYRPDWVLVFGDTNSALAGALTASKLQIPLIHVEAGLRCYNKKVPEEINRIIIDHISDLLFCYGSESLYELAYEGMTNNIFMVGDISHDAFVQYKAQLSEVRLIDRYYLATIHREENTSLNKLKSILQAIQNGAGETPVVIPLHPNTKRRLGNDVSNYPTFRFIDPVPYFEMLAFEQSAELIITDSGGVQKEAFWFGVPCITLREETEEKDTIIAGGNVLVGSDPDKIINCIQRAKKFPIIEDFIQRIYGDGTVAERIIEEVVKCDLL